MVLEGAGGSCRPGRAHSRDQRPRLSTGGSGELAARRDRLLRLRIEPNGRPSRCDVMRGFGNPSIDQWTCALVMQRGQFRPALDARGLPVSAWFGYKQVDIGR